MINIPVPAVLFRVENGNRRFEEYNDEFCDLIGYTREEVESNPNRRAIGHPEDILELEAKMDMAIGTRETFEHQMRLICKDGSYVWVSARLVFSEERDGVNFVFMIFWDLMDQKLTERKMNILNQQYQLMEQLGKDMPFEVDVLEQTILRSHKISEMRGIVPAVDMYVPFEEALTNIHPDDREEFEKAIAEASLNETTGKIKFRIRTSGSMSDDYVWYRLYYKSVTDDGKIIRIVGRLQNIDNDMKLKEEIRRDPLTKLLNKVEVAEEIQKAIDAKKDGNHVLFLIDIDNFKGVNDTFGHTFGDTVISDIAKTLKSQFRDNDIIGRVGGDEFVVFLENVSKDRATAKAKQLCEVLAREYTGGEIVRKTTASIGIAEYGVDGFSYSELFTKADQAMYRAKVSGKNSFSMAQDSDDRGIFRMQEIGDDARGYIKEEDKEFFLHAVNLLSHARNIDGSLNLLLTEILERYNFDLVAIIEKEQKKAEAILTNYASSKFTFFDNTAYDASVIVGRMKEQGQVYLFENANLDSLFDLAIKHGNVIPDAMRKNNSVACGKIEYVDGTEGILGFVSFDPNYIWERSTLNILSEILRIVGLFISHRTRIKKGIAEIRHIQNRDQLTGLYNLDSFKNNFRKKLAGISEKKVAALAYSDLNNFGYMNENYGYQIGDRILKLIARDIKDRADCVMACRLYSDFYVILLEGDSKADIIDSTIEGQSNFNNLYRHQYPGSGLSVTTGVYYIESRDIDIDIAIENVTLAWRAAKKAPDNRPVAFDSSMRAERGDEQKIIGEFYEALYRGDFKTYMQPKFSLETVDVYGAEALVRWESLAGSVVMPSKFIPALEKIGYITDLDFYVFEDVLKTMSRWKNEGKRQIVISVNFSGRHFDADSAEFISRIKNITSKYNINPQYVEIEITESIMAQNHDDLGKAIVCLKQLGYRIAVDDFGTGYSSLSVLTDIDADVIKIDKSFVDKEPNQRNINILKGIRGLIETAEKECVVEGIETDEQKEILLACGFHHGQGFLCSPPITVAEFEEQYL